MWALSAACLVALVFAVAVFVAKPRQFFFLSTPTAATHGLSRVGVVVGWIVMIVLAVAWIVVIVRINEGPPLGVVTRLGTSYAFFAWVAAALILASPR